MFGGYRFAQPTLRLLGEGKVFVLSGGSLLGDVPRGAQWKL